MGNIKAVIFDMDGVLTETSEVHFFAWKSLAKSIGITIDRAFNEQLKGVSRRDSLEKILALDASKTFSEDEKVRLMKQKNDMYVKMIQSTTRANLCEGMMDLLTTLKNESIKIAVASASKSAPLLIELLEIQSFVDYIVDPTTVASKPSPQIFLKAAEALKINPLDCIGIEDAPAGIVSIKKAGMYAVGIGDEKTLIGADLIYKKTSDVNFKEIVRRFDEK